MPLACAGCQQRGSQFGQRGDSSHDVVDHCQSFALTGARGKRASQIPAAFFARQAPLGGTVSYPGDSGAIDVPGDSCCEAEGLIVATASESA